MFLFSYFSFFIIKKIKKKCLLNKKMILSYNHAKKEKDLDTSLDSIKAEKINEIEELLSKQSK